MRLGLGKPEFAVMELPSSLMCTPDVMLPFSWHQGEENWRNNSATSIAETMASGLGQNIAKIKFSLVTASAETTKFEFSQPGGTNGQAAE